MARRLVNLTLDNLGDLPPRCRRCAFWELDPFGRDRAERGGDTELEKEAWVSATLLDWGSCGKLAYVDGVPAGYIMCAPPMYVPRSFAFPTSPVSPDAAVLMTLHVLPEFTGGGLGRTLVQAIAKDLTRRGVRRSRPSARPAGQRRTAWCQPGTCCRSGSRPSARIPAGLGFGWSSSRPSPGGKTSRSR